MTQARVTDGALREHTASAKTADPARKHGASEVALTNWKARYGGVELVNEGIRIDDFTDTPIIRRRYCGIAVFRAI